ncbi:hypothetical protein CR513_35992, partial [Mucuna pruriens]
MVDDRVGIVWVDQQVIRRCYKERPSLGTGGPKTTTSEDLKEIVPKSRGTPNVLEEKVRGGETRGDAPNICTPYQAWIDWSTTLLDMPF